MTHFIKFTLLLLLLSSTIQAQEVIKKEKFPGMFSLGSRTTLSYFNDDNNSSTGVGLGGQFRLQFSDKFNSEWFADFITSSVGDYATRNDYHIGWSLMYYPGKKVDFSNFMQPYFMAGHCLDYTKMWANNDLANFNDRWSIAMHAGAGTHFNFTPRFDFSLSAQYMIHLGSEIHGIFSDNQLLITEHNPSTVEGHLLVTLSFNYKIVNLW